MGVNGEHIREFRGSASDPATVEQLVTARDHGVNPDYVREMTTLSQRKLTLGADSHARPRRRIELRS